MLPAPLAILLILTILGGLFVGLRVIQRIFSPHPELVRKSLHISMGLTTLTFPWLFNDSIAVAILGGLAIAFLVAVRSVQPLNQNLGSVLHSVHRKSLGEIYFTVAVVLLFALSKGSPLLFCIPMLVLTLADAVAALIGVHYGRHQYTATAGQKSTEGSLSFFMVTFFSVHIPLLLFSPTGRAETLLIALILGLLVMMLEAIAWQGIDNFLIPIGTFLMLRAFMNLSATDLSIRLVVIGILVAFVFFYRRKTTLSDSALLGAAFIGYLSWFLGGWRWLLPPLLLFVSYPFLISWIRRRQVPLTEEERQLMPWVNPDHDAADDWQRVHDVTAVASVSAAGFLWLVMFVVNLGIASPLESRSEFLYPYTLAFAANLAVIGIAGLSPKQYWHWTNGLRVINYCLVSWALLFGTLMILEGSTRTFLWSAAGGLLGIVLVAIAYYVLQPTLRQFPTDTFNWLARTLLTLAGSAVVGIPLSLMRAYSV